MLSFFTKPCLKKPKLNKYKKERITAIWLDQMFNLSCLQDVINLYLSKSLLYDTEKSSLQFFWFVISDH